MSVIEEIAAERARQIAKEGWTPQHDDGHDNGAMAAAAAAYAVHGQPWEAQVTGGAPIAARWPWHTRWFKPTDRRRDLIKAAALIVAEIERLDRANAPLNPLARGEERQPNPSDKKDGER